MNNTDTKQRVAILAVVLAMTPVLSSAQNGPPPGFWPSGMKNIATRWNKYCLVGGSVCVERKVLEWGQTCHDGSDYDNLDGTVPPGFRYVSWRCETDNPNDNPPGGKSGEHKTTSTAPISSSGLTRSEAITVLPLSSGVITTVTSPACLLSDGTEIQCGTRRQITCGVPTRHPEQGEVCK